MTSEVKLTMLDTILGVDSSENAKLAIYLDMAEREIIAWRYGYVTEQPTEIPEELEIIQINAVVAGYNISGAEGQISHSENGYSRTWKYIDMVEYIHSNVIPFVGLV